MGGRVESTSTPRVVRISAVLGDILPRCLFSLCLHLALPSWRFKAYSPQVEGFKTDKDHYSGLCKRRDQDQAGRIIFICSGSASSQERANPVSIRIWGMCMDWMKQDSPPVKAVSYSG